MIDTSEEVALNQVICGDAYATLQGLPAAFVDTTVTSPPYWLHRQYIPDGHRLKPFEMGREPGMRKYIDDLADLFAQVYRVTRAGGTCWVNIGDKVAGPETRKFDAGYSDGETLGIPALFSEAMRKKGWRRVAEVVWSKPNPMTGARPNGPVPAHEMVYLFAKGEHYYDRHAAMSEARTVNRRGGKGGEVVQVNSQCRSVWDVPVVSFNARRLLGDFREDGCYMERDEGCPVHGDGVGPVDLPLFPRMGPTVACTCSAIDSIHFAPMAPEVIERCILLTTSERGNCRFCARPYRRVTRSDRFPTRPGTGAAVDPTGQSNRDPRRHVTRVETVGWDRDCDCDPVPPTPAVVYDPFCGTGAVPMVAQALGRDWLASELHPGYARRLAPARIAAGYKRKFR